MHTENEGGRDPTFVTNFATNLHSLAWLDRYLETPIREFLASNGKKIRQTLIRQFAEINLTSESDPPNQQLEIALETAGNIIEWIHAGSLIVDDIQDRSPTRRNRPALHMLYGEPLALNAGNALYFKAFQAVSKLGLNAEGELGAFRLISRCLVLAHEGQALDLGIRVTEILQREIPEATLECSRRKTGSLLECAAGLGSLLTLSSDCASTQIQRLDQACHYGNALGVALQISDDFSHDRQSRNGTLVGLKRFEDYRNRRCTWIFSLASQTLNASQFQNFLKLATESPESQTLADWIRELRLESKAIQVATHLLEQARTPIGAAFSPKLIEFESQLFRHYGMTPSQEEG